MNKKLMAMAVAGALGAPALAMAQASNVQVYGRANLGLDNYSAIGATVANGAGGVAIPQASTSGGNMAARNRVYDSGSRVGVRGSEDLGGGQRAVYQIETGVNIDTGNCNGQSGNTTSTVAGSVNCSNTSSGLWASRDSYAGMEGGWGRVSFGRQSVFWTNGTIAQTGANYVNIDTPMATVGGGFGRVPGIGTRINNALMYTLPNISGFGGYVVYAPQSEGGASTSPGGVQNTAKTEGARVTYEGRIKVQVDWAQTMAGTPSNRFAGNTAPFSENRVVGLKLGLGFPYAPGAQISAIVGRNTNHNTTAAADFTNAGDTVAQNAVVLNWEQVFGPIQALAMLGKTTNAHGCQANNSIQSAGQSRSVSGCTDSGAVSFLVGAKYLLSKRTGTYVTYNRTNNSGNGCLDYTAASYQSAPGTTAGNCGIAPGTDPRVFAIGMLHNF